MGSLFNIDTDKCFDRNDENNTRPAASTPTEHRRRTQCLSVSTTHRYRRGFSEARILEAMKLERLQDGCSYHFISAGDADSLSFLKVVLANFQRLEYLLISTWVMNAEDILLIREWIEEGILNRVDFYLGEIFPNSYRIEWGLLQDLIRDTKCGRLCNFKNHSKIFAGEGGGNRLLSNLPQISTPTHEPNRPASR